MLKRRDDVDNSSDEDDDDDATTTTTSSAGTVGLESELMAMAMNRRESFQAKSPDVSLGCLFLPCSKRFSVMELLVYTFCRKRMRVVSFVVEVFSVLPPRQLRPSPHL